MGANQGKSYAGLRARSESNCPFVEIQTVDLPCRTGALLLGVRFYSNIFGGITLAVVSMPVC